MFNFKLAGIAAGAAFVLSFIIGLIGGAGFGAVVLRAFFFGAFFFGLFCLVQWLAAQFLPELLAEGEDDLGFAPGSRIDISEGPVSGAFPSDTSDTVDDIAGRPSARPAPSPLDRGENTGYNEEGEVSSLEPAGPGGAEILPDIDGLSENEPTEVLQGVDEAFSAPEPRRPAASSRRPPPMAGDFNPKELAQAIQTVLKKDDKG